MTINIYTITKEERMIGRTARKAGNPTNKHGDITEMLASQSQETWNAHWITGFTKSRRKLQAAASS